MSEEFRKSIVNRLPRLPPTRAPWADEVEGEEVLGEEDELGDLTSPGLKRKDQDFSPLSAGMYFDQALEITPPGSDTTFRGYMVHPTSSADKPTYLVCHHGAGASGLSFATLAKEVKRRSAGQLGILAFDCRGHGQFWLMTALGDADSR